MRSPHLKTSLCRKMVPSKRNPPQGTILQVIQDEKGDGKTEQSRPRMSARKTVESGKEKRVIRLTKLEVKRGV
jgi:hypothetical protein